MSNINGGDEQHTATMNNAARYAGTDIDPIILSPKEDCSDSTRATAQTAGSVQHDDRDVDTPGTRIIRKILRGPALHAQPEGQVLPSHLELPPSPYAQVREYLQQEGATIAHIDVDMELQQF